MQGLKVAASMTKELRCNEKAVLSHRPSCDEGAVLYLALGASGPESCSALRADCGERVVCSLPGANLRRAISLYVSPKIKQRNHSTYLFRVK